MRVCCKMSDVDDVWEMLTSSLTYGLDGILAVHARIDVVGNVWKGVGEAVARDLQSVRDAEHGVWLIIDNDKPL